MLLGLKHAAVCVHDVRRALRFYCEYLGFEPYLINSDWAMVYSGGTSLSLIPQTQSSNASHSSAQASATEGSPAPLPTDRFGGQSKSSGLHHLGIVAQSREEVDTTYIRLKSVGHPGLQAPKLHRDDSYGFYFSDTEGNPLECIFIPHLPTPQKVAGQLPELRDTGVILIAHGSHDPAWRQPFERLLEQLKQHFKASHCALAYMEMCRPTLEEVAEQMIDYLSCKRLVILPAFMASGAHVARDIPNQIELLRRRFPKAEFTLTPALGESAWVQEALTTAAIYELRRRLPRSP